MGIIKFGGLASGLDTDGIIKALMAVERRPIALLDQRKEKTTGVRDAWKDLNSRLRNLENRVGDLRKLTSDSWNAKKLSVADEKVLTASATASALAGTYTVAVTSLAEATTWQSALLVTDPDEERGLVGPLSISSAGENNGESIDIESGDSIKEIAAKINADKERLGITASVVKVDTDDYRLVVKGNNGQANDFTLTGGVAVMLVVDESGGLKRTTAADAQLTVNAVPVSSAENSVKDAIPGVTLNLLTAGQTTTVSVTADMQKAIDAVKGFVDQYNSVVEFIAQNTKYEPEEKKAGSLMGDGMARTIQSALYSRITNPVEGVDEALNSLSAIGITIEGKTSEGFSNKLTFDQAKFKEKLESDPEAVQQLFTLADGDNLGIAARTEEWIKGYTQAGGLISSQTKSLDSQLKSIKDRKEFLEQVILPAREKRLNTQFMALEKAMAMFQNQGNWLQGQIGSLL